MMEAYPGTRMVERNQEQIARAQTRQQLGGIIGVADGSSERGTDAIEHRESEYQRASTLVHPHEHHLAQIVDEAAVGAREVLDELDRVLDRGDCERGQLERGGPAFGLHQQPLEIQSWQIPAEPLSEELRPLLGIESKLA